MPIVVTRLLADYRDYLPFILLMATSFVLPTASHRIVFYLLAPYLIYFLYKHRADWMPYTRTLGFAALVAYLGYFLLSLLWSDAPHMIEPYRIVRDIACVFLFTCSLTYLLTLSPVWDKQKLIFIFTGAVAVLGLAALILFFMDGRSIDHHRLHGLGRYTNPNHFAFLLSFAALMLISLPVEKETKANRARYALVAFLLVLVTLTGSRGALAGWGACLMLMLVFQRSRGAAVMAALIAVCVLASVLFAGLSFERITKGGDGFRPAIWSEALSGIAEKPVIGHGIAVEASFTDLNHGDGWTSAHNAFIGHAHAGGVIGLTLYLLLLGHMVWQCYLGYRMRRHTPQLSYPLFLSYFTALMVCFMLATSQFSFNHFTGHVRIHWLIFWVPFAMAWALEIRHKKISIPDHPA